MKPPKHLVTPEGHFKLALQECSSHDAKRSSIKLKLKGYRIRIKYHNNGGRNYLVYKKKKEKEKWR